MIFPENAHSRIKLTGVATKGNQATITDGRNDENGGKISPEAKELFSQGNTHYAANDRYVSGIQSAESLPM